MGNLARAYRLTKLYATDNIMPQQFLSDVLPQLAGESEQFELFYEVKANLREKDLDLFVLSGLTHIQAGIEALSSRVLTIMAKGVNARQCIKLLRECLSRQINVRWNCIYGFPGETEADYTRVLEILPYLEHLQPPSGFGPIRIDRYSPYQASPDFYGIGPLRPLPSYQLVYPANAPLEDLAYAFQADYRTEFTRNESLVKEFSSALMSWRRRWERERIMPRLWRLPGTGEEVTVEDTRSCSAQRYHYLTPEVDSLLKRLGDPTRCDRIGPVFRRTLQPLLDAHIVLEYEDHFISLLTDPLTGVRLRKEKSRQRAEKPVTVAESPALVGKLALPLISKLQ
jgi:ribosomal peptide maturation radical SAM protein 1